MAASRLATRLRELCTLPARGLRASSRSGNSGHVSLLTTRPLLVHPLPQFSSIAGSLLFRNSGAFEESLLAQCDAIRSSDFHGLETALPALEVDSRQLKNGWLQSIPQTLVSARQEGYSACHLSHFQHFSNVPLDSNAEPSKLVDHVVSLQGSGFGALIRCTEGSGHRIRHCLGKGSGAVWRPADVRYMSTKVFREGRMRVYLQSPGMIADPYQSARPKLPFIRRWFTLPGWREIRHDVLEYLKTAYTVARLRQKNRGFTQAAVFRDITAAYTQINKAIAKGDQTALRQLVTETTFTAMKREMREREKAGWSRLEWALHAPITGLRTAQARLIAIDPKNTDNAFVQLTVVIRSKQIYAAYDKKGKVVAGDPKNEVLVEDIWVFERPLLHPEIKWRLCGRIGA